MKQKCPACQCQMTQVHVGKTKEALDQVDLSLAIADVTGIFGNFVKFTTDETAGQEQVGGLWLCIATIYMLSCLSMHTHTYTEKKCL